MSTIYFSLLIENRQATGHNRCMLCWYLHALCHSEDIRFADYICTILNYAADLRRDGPAEIGMLAYFTPECVIRIYLAVPSVLNLIKVDHHTDCICVQSGILPILI